MASPFLTAASRTAGETLDLMFSNYFGVPLKPDLRAEAIRVFESKLEPVLNAFSACTTADELERKLTVQRAGQALEEFIRATKARKDLDYARERFWAVFTPHQPTRLF